MWPTKRLVILWAIIATISQLFSVHHSYASDEETYFIATAYYSPLPGQNRYTTGSYEGDIRLNGSWIVTASGKEVFQGLLAGPKNYPFGTKIYFEWYGIGEIADRWGAIVKAWERGHSYDRIDIWMWYGDEGLERALKWGSRKIKGKIVVPSAEVTLTLGESPLWYFDSLRVHPNSGATEIMELQEIFTKADLYSGNIDGDYQSIRNELIEFQIKNQVISGYADEEAGYFGPKTVEILKKLYAPNISMLVEEDKELFAKYNHRHASELYKIILEYWDLEVNPDSESETIKELQRLLLELWEYSGNIDGQYKSVENALIDLQIKIGLVERRDDWGAGYFWNKTKTALWIYYEKHDTEDITVTLSETEKDNVDNALKNIRKRLKTEELKWWKKMEKRLETLKNQIDTALLKVTDPLMRAKLIYLQEIL